MKSRATNVPLFPLYGSLGFRDAIREAADTYEISMNDYVRLASVAALKRDGIPIKRREKATA